MKGAYKEPEPIFVVGMNGSGTTMLLDNLGRHPTVYGFPKETRLIPYLIAQQESFGDLHHDANFQKLWRTVLRLNVFQQVNNNTAVPLPENWKDFPRNLAAVLDGVFSYFSQQAGKQRWCEKTPQHVQHIRSIARLFPHAKFIHIIRDGRDCAASFNRRWHRTPELTIYRWKNIVRNGCSQGLQLGKEHYMEIHYEELTTDPSNGLSQVCNFLGIPFDPAVLESAQPYLQTENTESLQMEAGGLQPNSGKWKSYFNTKTRKSLEKICGSTLAQHGYTTDYPDSDINISWLNRRYWNSKDVLVQYFREIILKLGGKIDRPWRVILSKPFTAFRQRRQNKY
ncbi:MAG: sulfotransferase [Gammaproteobacteria bacterium]|nr:sulfotransferase [Gammaproteobacteria bacterium]MCP4928657.1 sulfotransferase [Gammaproteobacteria bacterium]